MLKRDTIVLVVAAVSGLISFMLVANYLKSSSGIKLQFVMAVNSIPQGMTIAKEDLVLSSPIKKESPEMLYISIEDVAGNIAKEDIPKESVIHRSQVMPQPVAVVSVRKKMESLPIPAGMSAMTLAIRQIDSVPEGIRVGSFVDILGTVVNFEGVRNVAPIVRGAQVLSMELGENDEISSISVAVTSNGALAVSKAIPNNKLNLVLRSGGGEKGSYNAEAESIEIIRGIEKSKSASSK